MSIFERKNSKRAPEALNRFRRSLYVDVTIFGTLVALAVFGVSVTEYSPQQGFRYWLAMSVLIGGTSIVTAWLRARREGHSQADVLRRLLLHWGSLFLALYVVFLLNETTGRLNNPDAGLVALSMVALVTFLAGVHFDWRFILVGVLLGIGVMGAAFVETYFWIVLVATVLIVAVGLIIFWWGYQLERNRIEGKDSEPQS